MKRINKPTKAIFGIGDLGFSFMVGMETSFFLLFLTDVAGLPLGLAALVSTITGVSDMITALIAGIIIDKTHFKWGKFRSWLIIAPPLVLLFFAFQFTAIGGNALAATIISLGYIIGHFIFNIVWTAHRSLPSVLTDDATERAFLSGRCAAGASIGKLLGSKLIPILVLAFAAAVGGNPTLGYTITAIFASIIMLLGYYITFFATKGYDAPPSPKAKAEKEDDKSADANPSFGDILKGVFKNKPLLSVLGFDFMRLIAFYLFLACAAYYAKAMFFDDAASIMGNVLLLANLGTLIGSLVSKNFVHKIGTKKTLVFSIVSAAIVLAFTYFVRENIIAVYVLTSVAFFLFGTGYGLTTSLYVNCATYSEYETGKNTQGFIMSVSAFAIKMSIVVRGLIITGGLAAIGYVAADVNAGVIAPGIADGAALLCFVVPAVIWLLSLLPLIPFKLTDEDVVRMSQEIEKRKQAAA